MGSLFDLKLKSQMNYGHILEKNYNLKILLYYILISILVALLSIFIKSS